METTPKTENAKRQNTESEKAGVKTLQPFFRTPKQQPGWSHRERKTVCT